MTSLASPSHRSSLIPAPHLGLLLAISSATLLTTVDHLAAQAPGAHDARSERLQGLTQDELEQLDGLLQRGPVALVEFADTDADQLPGINVAAIVNTDAARVAALLANPKGYPSFMRTLDEVEIVQRTPQTVVYDWRWQLGLFSLEGRNAMTALTPSPERARAGYRFTVDSQSGDFGKGRMTLRVLPRGPSTCLLVLSMRLDLRTANYVTRELAKAARSINRSANMALAYTLVLSTRRAAERAAGYVPKTVPAPALQKPQLDLRALSPLLLRGDVVLLDMVGDRLDQLAVVGFVYEPMAKVRKVMLDASAFGSALLPGSTAEVVRRDESGTTFDWEIDLPLVGVSGRMRMREDNPYVNVDAVAGALNGGNWRFETVALGKEATSIASWARFDIESTSWFVRNLAQSDPFLGHGMSAASQVMLLRALRSRTGKLALKQ